MISLMIWIFAAVCDAIMDTLVHHYSSSIFWRPKISKYWNWNKFWNPEYSWRNKYVDGVPENGFKKLFWKINYPVQLTDAWHLFKTIKIILLALSILLFNHKEVLLGCEYNWWSFPLVLLIFGVCWNSIFSLMYNKILKINP